MLSIKRKALHYGSRCPSSELPGCRGGRLALFLAAVLLASCQSLSTGPSAVDASTSAARSPNTQNDLRGLVEFAAWLHRLPPERLAQVTPELADKAAVPGAPADRLRLALLFGLPDTPFSDAQEARRLFKEILANTADNKDGIAEFVRLLLAELNVRTQLHDTLVTQVEEERDARKQLQHKLDELKTIEEQLAKRDTAKHPDAHE
jgi:hypothetical protein